MKHYFTNRNDGRAKTNREKPLPDAVGMVGSGADSAADVNRGKSLPDAWSDRGARRRTAVSPGWDSRRQHAVSVIDSQFDPRPYPDGYAGKPYNLAIGRCGRELFFRLGSRFARRAVYRDC